MLLRSFRVPLKLFHFAPSAEYNRIRNPTPLKRTRTFSMTAIGTQTVDTTQRLAALRRILANEIPVIDAFVIPSEDARKFPKISLI